MQPYLRAGVLVTVGEVVGLGCLKHSAESWEGNESHRSWSGHEKPSRFRMSMQSLEALSHRSRHGGRGADIPMMHGGAKA